MYEENEERKLDKVLVEEQREVIKNIEDKVEEKDNG
jgi:hypothetical protein